MDQQPWTNTGFYNYYPNDNRSSERMSASPATAQSALHPDSGRPLGGPGPSTASASGPIDSNPRRYSQPQHSQPHFTLSGPPPHTATAGGTLSSSAPSQPPGPGSSGGMPLPPFSQTFYPPYHSSNTHHQAQMPSHTAHMYHSPLPPAHGYGSYPMQSPVSMAPPLPGGGSGGGGTHRPPPPHTFSESSRLPGINTVGHGGNGGPSGGGYPTSPTHPHHLSPTSPINTSFPPISSTGSSSSSAYPSVQRGSASLPKPGPSTGSIGRGGRGAAAGATRVKRRGTSPVDSNRSWSADGDADEMQGEGGKQQPWGMPQDAYKALNPKDKKQVRNRIGARRFRAKRKDYVATLEASSRAKDDEIAALHVQLESQRNEINDYRHRLGLPLIPPPPLLSPTTSTMTIGAGSDHMGLGLGLGVPQPQPSENWDMGKDERD